MPKTEIKSVSKKRKRPKTLKSAIRKEIRPKMVKNVKTMKKRCAEDSIAMSKQLSVKKKIREQNIRASSRNNEVRICPNGKPIPSLSDLERMYEDSDDDTPAVEAVARDSSVTPKPQATTSEEPKLLSPTTISKISHRMMEMISNISDPAELINEITPSPAVVPVKKRKKPDEPYIVGCKDRPQVIKKAKVNFCKGDENYGVENEEPEDDLPPQKRAKKSKIPTYSKSIFNAKSDEIAEHLKQNDDGNESSDSNKTINYEYMNSSSLQNSRPLTFSPLPSTSRDNATFFKNDELFNESLKDQDNVSTQSDLEIIENPCETIVIRDEPEQAMLPISVKNTYREIENNCIEIIDIQPEPSNLQPIKPELQRTTNIEESTIDEDDCVIVEPEPVPETSFIEPEQIPIVNEYHDINLNPPIEVIDDEVIANEVIDVDALIAQNYSILEKFNASGSRNLNVVFEVATPVQAQEQPQFEEVDNFFRSRRVIEIANRSRNEPEVEEIEEGDIPTVKGVVVAVNSLGMKYTTKDLFVELSPRKCKITCNEGFFTSEDYAALVALASLEPDSLDSVMTVGANPITSSTANVSNKHDPLTSKKNQIDNIRMDSPKSLDGIKNFGDCPICMDALDTNAIASTICGHVFCMKCIRAATAVNGKRCPTCRKSLRGKNSIHQLYL